MMETLLELSLTAVPIASGIARMAVSLVAIRLGFACDAVADIDTAVGEACADALGYGQRACADAAALQVRAAAGSGLLIISVEMAGRVSDPPPQPHQGPFPSEHSLGEFVLAALMDTVSYRYTEARGTSIRMAKALPMAAQEAVTVGRGAEE
jgi:anti-sigma regulatory factor (Ser/Thr protein kinase)